MQKLQIKDFRVQGIEIKEKGNKSLLLYPPPQKYKCTEESGIWGKTCMSSSPDCRRLHTLSQSGLPGHAAPSALDLVLTCGPQTKRVAAKGYGSCPPSCPLWVSFQPCTRTPTSLSVALGQGPLQEPPLMPLQRTRERSRVTCSPPPTLTQSTLYPPPSQGP